MWTMDPRTLVLCAATACFALAFCVVTSNQVERYLAHALATAVIQQRNYAPLPFPAVSICVKYFFQGWLANASAKFRESDLLQTTSYLYQIIDPNFNDNDVDIGGFNSSVTDAMWRTYFTLDKVLKRPDPVHPGPAYCSVGGVSCSYPDDVVWPGQDNAALVVAVPTGTWTSRFLADSGLEFVALCHTLAPNVSLDFSVASGNAMMLRWNDFFSWEVPDWTVYVHDVNEMVLLDTYSMDSLPSLVLRNRRSNIMASKAKARFVVESRVKAGTSAHPCSDAAGYSSNACDLAFCWERRFDQMTDNCADNNCSVKCVSAGIFLPEGTYSGNLSDGSLGFQGMLYGQSPSVLEPPIGNELYATEAGSGCVERCNTFTYNMVQDVLNDIGDLDYYGGSDLMLYFSSPAVEVTVESEDYSAVSLLSDIGGSLGLFLGLSLYSVVQFGFESASVIKYVRDKLP